MVSLTIRDVDEELRRHIRFRAAAHGTSMQTEMRLALRAAFLTAGSSESYPALPQKQPAWVKSLAGRSLGLGSFDDVPLPDRSHRPRLVEEWIR